MNFRTPMSRRPSRSSWPPLLREAEPSREVAAVCRRLMFDVVGLVRRGPRDRLCPRRSRQRSRRRSLHGAWTCGRLDLYDAALVNGTAAHGEDYDDTFEGGPVHAGAVVVPAVLAAARASRSRRQRGDARDRGRNRIHVPAQSSWRRRPPTRPASTRRRSSALRRLRPPSALRSASAGRRSPAPSAFREVLASGIIEYLADGSSTKRLHAGAAAQAGLRAALPGGGGLYGAALCLRGQARPLQGLRAVEDAGFQTAHRRSRAGLGRRGPCLQALCVRDDDPALRGLRHPPRRGRRARGRHRVDRVQGRRRAPCIACGNRSQRSTGPRTAMPENSRPRIAWP